MAKVWSNVMLVLPNMTMEVSNVRGKKKKGIIECDKNIVTYDVGIPNVVMELSNVRKKLKYHQM